MLTTFLDADCVLLAIFCSGWRSTKIHMKKHYVVDVCIAGWMWGSEVYNMQNII